MTTHREKYHNLKRKLKFLLYENECFQEALRSTQRHLLKIKRDKHFLLDRLLRYEKVSATLSDRDDETNSSEDELHYSDAKRKRVDICTNNQSHLYSCVSTKSQNSNKKKKTIGKNPKAITMQIEAKNIVHCSLKSDGHMTPEEVEKHLESRQNYLELVPEKAPPTVPTEMFSNDILLDK